MNTGRRSPRGLGRLSRFVAVASALGFVASACTTHNSGSSTPNPSSPTTLEVAAGSELADMQPILDDLRKATGVTVKLSPIGSLDGAEKVANGTAGDAAWFGTDKYVALAGASSKVLTSAPIMLSPVIVGVRQSAGARLGWTGSKPVTWKDIATAAGSGKFHYAMTSSTASNSGFSALVSVATAFAGSQALSSSSINTAGLKGFLAGQALTSGSSGFLANAFISGQNNLDGIINYESVLMSLNAGGKLTEPLTLVYPSEGIVTANYPLMLLNPAKRDAFNKATAYLLRADVQSRIQELTSRRPVVPGVPLSSRFTGRLLVEAPFPANLSVVQALLEQYQTTLRRPAHTIYVLDTSGSMGDDTTPDSQATGKTRIERLKTALLGLAGADTSFTGHFTRFAPREKVTLITFSSAVNDNQTFAIDSTDPTSAGLTQVRQFITGLTANGGTAIYSALNQAYTIALQTRASEPDSYTTIVLMTDGENNEGIDASTFLQFVASTPGKQPIRIFTVLFGEASPSQLSQIASATGGQVFDARSAPLDQVFKEIRGYQ